jgi:hypothetical protein
MEAIEAQPTIPAHTSIRD